MFVLEEEILFIYNTVEYFSKAMFCLVKNKVNQVELFLKFPAKLAVPPPVSELAGARTISRYRY